MSSRAVSAIASGIVSGVLAVQAIVVGLIVASAAPVLLPVTADFGGGIQLTSVNLGAAVTVLLAFSALCRGVAVVRPSPLVRWIEWSQVSAITVFLVAELNGVRDVAALVSLYALTAGASLFLVLHRRSDAGLWPFSFGAAVAIVPWGVIAFYQIGAIVAGDSPAPLIRVVTIAMLAIAAVYWAAAFRTGPSERAHALLVVAGVSLCAWLVVYGLQSVVA